jgi:hypothetical protein
MHPYKIIGKISLLHFNHNFFRQSRRQMNGVSGMWRCVDLVSTDVSVPTNAGSSLADFSTMKMEPIRSFEASVLTKSTRRHFPEDGILHSHLCENLRSYKEDKSLCTFLEFNLVKYPHESHPDMLLSSPKYLIHIFKRATFKLRFCETEIATLNRWRIYRIILLGATSRVLIILKTN